MTALRPHLSVDDVLRLIDEQCLARPALGLTGAEVEWIPLSAADPSQPLSFEHVRAVAESAPRPAGSALTFEPGGQLELSSPPMPNASAACDAVALDRAGMQRALADAGIVLAGAGLDARPARRVIDAPRYRAMESYFDADGDAGRTMMCSSAAIQVNVCAGEGDDASRRWRVAHAAGPLLAAAFANSPLLYGRPSGTRSYRMANWWRMDGTRTRPALSSGDPVHDWARYALDARVMFIRSDAATFTPVSDGLTFARWIRDGHELGFPDESDLVYHLTTLFPPVRLRGWLELRMLDALPDPWWRVAVVVAGTIVGDAETAEATLRATAPVADRWSDAFRDGLTDPEFALAARSVFDAVLDALPRTGAGRQTTDAVAAFADRFVHRGRCPADDVLDAWAAERTDEPLEATWS